MSFANSSPSSSLLPSTSEQIIFKDNQHATNISGKLLKFYKDKEFFDIDIKADNNNNSIKIQAHKIVLTSSSDYFLEIFRHNPAISKTIEIKEIPTLSLKLIIDFMYSGSIELSLEKIESILLSAVFLKMKNLVNGCCEFLEKNLNTENCLRWLKLSKQLNLSELREKFLKFLYKNFEKVTKETEFLILDVIELKELLFKNNTYRNLEEIVFKNLIAWIEYDKNNRKHLQLELLSMVRYQFLTAKFIIENIKLVEESSHLIHDWLIYHLSPESRTNEELQFTSTLSSVTSESKTVINLKENGDTIETEKSKKFDEIAAVHLNHSMEIEVKSYIEELKNWSIVKRSRPSPFLKNLSQHSLIVIDEKLFIVGGVIGGKSTNSVQCIDLKTFQWTDLPKMRVARCESQLANLNGNICVFGGFEKSDKTIFSECVEIFNTTTQQWNDLQPLQTPDRRNKITGHNGILYIFDFHYGCLQCYDASTDKWTSKKQPIDDDVRDFFITGVDHLLYFIVIGGDYHETSNYSRYGVTFKRGSVKRFDLSMNSWSELAKLPKNTSTVQMATIIRNKIMFLRGGEITEYNAETNEFSVISGSIGKYISYHIFPFKF